MPLHEHGRSSKELLDPYLTGILDSNPTCQSVFQLFYMQYFPLAHNPPLGDAISNLFTLPHLQPDVFQAVDQAAHDAENAFWSAVQVVGSQRTGGRDRGSWMDYHIDSVHKQDLE
jgi:hypothetical protein